MMKHAAQRDWSKQEVLHYATLGESVMTSFKFQRVNLNPDYDAEINPDKPGKIIRRKDELSWYANRPQNDHMDDLNFDTFLKHYTLDTDKELKENSEENMKNETDV